MKSQKKSKPPFKFLWITDPWDTLDHPNETTFRLAQEAMSLGFECHWCDVKTIHWNDGQTWLKSQRIRRMGVKRERDSFELEVAQITSPLKFSSLQYRTDPPVDLAYLQPLQLLHLALSHQKNAPELVNPLSALLISNEKLEAGLLNGLAPPMVVSSQWDVLDQFGMAEGTAVLKPMHMAQSKGVELLNWHTPEAIGKARLAVREQTGNFERPVVLQRYLPGIQKGETRLWFLDGKLLVHAVRLPVQGDFRVNTDRGSQLASRPLKASEKRSALKIGSHLRRMKVRLAAVDLIDGYITDFNFTSPGLLTQIEALTGKNLARVIVKALSRKVF
jgi:glutathione synthase